MSKSSSSTAKTEWKKLPSVTTGGKPFFFYNVEERLTVVWDRINCCWIIQKSDGSPLLFPDSEAQSEFATPKAAMRAAEKYISLKGGKQ